jgi:hypothetical protein
MLSPIITLTRKDNLFDTSPNPYETSSNFEALSAMGITEDSIKAFLGSLAKCSSLIFLKLITTCFIFMLICPFLLYNNSYEGDSFTYIYLPAAIYCEVILLIVIFFFIILHRQMLRKAQHIIDIQNKRQPGYKFSLNALTMRLNVEKIGDVESGLISTVLDELLKELYVFPGMGHYQYYVNLGYFSESDTICEIYSGASAEYQKVNFDFRTWLLIVVALVAGLIVLIIIVCVYLGVMYISFVMVGWFTIVGGLVLGIFRYKMSKVASYVDIQNTKYFDSGIYYDITNWVLYIYVFNGDIGITGYKNDVRTAKYFI